MSKSDASEFATRPEAFEDRLNIAHDGNSHQLFDEARIVNHVTSDKNSIIDFECSELLSDLNGLILLKDSWKRSGGIVWKR